jgi:hypothetical protein
MGGGIGEREYLPHINCSKMVLVHYTRSGVYCVTEKYMHFVWWLVRD